MNIDIPLQPFVFLPQPKRGGEMSLVVAIVCGDRMVVAADELLTAGDENAYYKVDSEKFSKLFVIGGRHIAALAGNAGPHKILERDFGECSFEETKTKCLNALTDDYRKGQKDFEFSTLICGFGENRQPEIIKTRFYRNNDSEFKPMRTSGEVSNGRTAIGVDKHGALYWLYKAYTTNLNLNEMKRLAVFCIRETAFQDLRVGESVKMYVLEPGKAPNLVPDSEMSQIVETCDLKREILNRELFG